MMDPNEFHKKINSAQCAFCVTEDQPQSSNMSVLAIVTRRAI